MKMLREEKSTDVKPSEKDEKRIYLRRQCCGEYKAPTECCDHTKLTFKALSQKS